MGGYSVGTILTSLLPPFASSKLLQAPLLLWVAAVVVIFGVSYSNLQDLQGPLASQVSSVLFLGARHWLRCKHVLLNCM